MIIVIANSNVIYDVVFFFLHPNLSKITTSNLSVSTRDQNPSNIAVELCGDWAIERREIKTKIIINYYVNIKR